MSKGLPTWTLRHAPTTVLTLREVEGREVAKRPMPTRSRTLQVRNRDNGGDATIGRYLFRCENTPYTAAWLRAACKNEEKFQGK